METNDLVLSSALDRDAKIIKRLLKVDPKSQTTHVVAIAIHKEPRFNRPIEIVVPTGAPLTCEVHNQLKHCYYVNGFSFYSIGTIPVSYCLHLDDMIWESYVPLPFSLVKNYMTEDQKKKFEVWKRQHAKVCRIRYFQTTNIN